MKQKELIYPGALKNIKNLLRNFTTKNIFLVRGNNSYSLSGAENFLNPILKEYNLTEFKNFSVNPKLEEAKEGFDSFRRNNCDLILAVGGGSVIDMAKVIKYLIIKELKSNTKQIPKLIAIPTTAGTGSEATHFAVVYINGVKHSYAHEALLPNVALVDANLLQGQTNYQMAVSGIDAFAQGIESFWSIHSTSESMKYSEKAIKLVWENLENAIKGDKGALTKIAEGSNWAGKAINIAKTTAPHALSYGFTSEFGLPHGHAVALFLPFFIDNHKTAVKINCTDIRGVSWLHDRVLDIANIMNVELNNLAYSIVELFNRCMIDIRFINLNINKEKFQNAVDKLSDERLNNNPTIVNSIIIESIFNCKHNNK